VAAVSADAALELVADAENGKMPPGDALTLLKTAVYDVAARGKVLRSPVIATDGEGTYLTNVIGQARKELEGLYQAESQ